MLLWGEAAMKIVYVQNKIPHRMMKNMTPEESFSGKKLDVEHLRIFGCQVYIHVPKNKRENFKPSGKRRVFVGYSESSKEYKIYVLGQ
jgi:hypothetical protein